MIVIVVEVDALLAARADAAPATNECSAAEEIRLDRATETCRVEQGGSDHGFDTKSTEARYETMIDLDGKILM